MTEARMAIPAEGEKRADGVTMWFVSFTQPDGRGKKFGARGFKAPCLLHRTDTATGTIRHDPPMEAVLVCRHVGSATVRAKETA